MEPIAEIERRPARAVEGSDDDPPAGRARLHRGLERARIAGCLDDDVGCAFADVAEREVRHERKRRGTALASRLGERDLRSRALKQPRDEDADDTAAEDERAVSEADLRIPDARDGGLEVRRER